MGAEAGVSKKLRVLAFHGYRTSGAFLKSQIDRWNPAIHELVEFSYLDGPTPARGESDIKDIFKGPYFEWMEFNETNARLTNYEESIRFVLDHMEKNGPFHGFLGFSQGSVIAGCIIACQNKKRAVQGKSAADLPPIRFFISISGTYLSNPDIADVYVGGPMDVRTLHLFGATDFMKELSTAFLRYWKDPVVILHRRGHTVPRLDEKATATIVSFLKRFDNLQPSPPGEQNGEVSVGNKSPFKLRALM